MQIKAIKELIKPNYPTNNEHKSSLLKFLFNNKKITLSLVVIVLVNNWKNVYGFPTIEINPTTMLEISGSYVVRPFNPIKWTVGIFLPILFIIYEIIFNIVNYKNSKSLTSDAKKLYFKKRFKTIIIKLVICLIVLVISWIIEFLLFRF